MGTSVERLRDLVELANSRVRVKGHLRKIDGKIVKVKGYDYLRDLVPDDGPGFAPLQTKKPKKPKKPKGPQPPNLPNDESVITDTFDLPEIGPNTTDEQVYAVDAMVASHVKIHIERWAAKLNAYRAQHGAPSNSWYYKITAQNDEEREFMRKVFADDDQFRLKLEKLYDALVAIKELPPGQITKYTKTNAGKKRERVKDMLDLFTILAALEQKKTDPSLELDPMWVTKAIERIESKLNGKAWNWSSGVGDFRYGIEQHTAFIKDWAWQEKISNVLPFDLTNPPPKLTMVQYAQSQGSVYAAAMTEEELKSWINANLGGWPSKNQSPFYQHGDTDASLAERIELRAHQRVILANIKAQALAALGDIADSPDPEPLVTTVPDPADDPSKILEFDLWAMKFLPTMVDAYTTDEAQPVASVVNIGPDLWEVTEHKDTGETGEIYEVDTKKALEIIQHEHLKPAIGATKVKTHLDAIKESMPPFDTTPAGKKPWNEWIKEHGGSYPIKMVQEEKFFWARMYLQGNYVGIYSFEEFLAKKTLTGKVYEHKGKETHPGSPNSPAGAQAIQALSEYIAHRPWGEAFFNSKIDVIKYKPPGGTAFDISVRTLDGPEWNASLIEQAYLDLGLYVGTEYEGDPNGAPLPERVQAVKTWLMWLPHIPLPKAFAQSNAVPAPKQVKLKEKMAKPDPAITDEAWDLIESIEALPTDADVFKDLSPMLSAMTPEQVEMNINNFSWNNYPWSKYAGMKGIIKDAPLNIKKAWLYATGSSVANGDVGYAPDGLTNAIHERAQKGFYAPVYPEGEVTFPWGMKYIIKPGEVVKKDPSGDALMVIGPGDEVVIYGPTVKKTLPKLSPLAKQAMEWWMTWLPSAHKAQTGGLKEVYFTKGDDPLQLEQGDVIFVAPSDKQKILNGFAPQYSVFLMRKDGSTFTFTPDGTMGIPPQNNPEAFPALTKDLGLTEQLTYGEGKVIPYKELLFGSTPLVLHPGHTAWIHAESYDPETGQVPESGVVVVRPDGMWEMYNGLGDKAAEPTLEENKFNMVAWLNSGWEPVSSNTEQSAYGASPPTPIAKAKAKQDFDEALGIMFDYDWDLIQVADDTDQLAAKILAGDLKPFGDWTTASAEDVDAALLAGEAHPTVIENAPSPVKKLMAWSLQNKDEGLSSLINYLASHGHWGFKVAKPEIDPTKPYAQHIAMGQTTDEAIIQHWTPLAKRQYMLDYGIKNIAVHDANASLIIAQHLSISNPRVPTQPPQTQIAEQKLVFHKIKQFSTASVGGGSHTMYKWGDQTDKEYLSKTMPSDPNSKGRVEAEDAANKIGRLHGFAQPKTWARKMPDGGYHYVQEILPGDKIIGYGVDDLTDAQLAQVAEEHVLDWVLSNHDSHNDNFIKSPDGKVIHGVDKGQAFKFFPNDKLAVGYRPKGNGDWVYYDVIYKAIIDKKMPKHRIDALTEHLLKRAKRVSRLRDDQHRALLEQGLKSFPGGVTPAAQAKGWTHEQLVDALMERKKNAAQDFFDFYKSLYDKAGLEWPFESLDALQEPKIVNDKGEVFVGISADVASEIKTAQAHGIATFFAGDALEDQHILWWEEKEKDGGDLLMGEGRLRAHADSQIMAWINSQAVDNQVGTPIPQQNPAIAAAATLPFNDSWFNAIVAAAKTVNVHSADGNYTATTIATFESAQQSMLQLASEVETHMATTPNKPYQGTTLKFVDLHQQSEWLAMTKLYLTYAEQIQKAKTNGTKTYPDPDKPEFFTKVQYTPKKKPKVVNEWTDNEGNVTIQELADGSWLQTDHEQGTQEKLTPEAAKAQIESDAFNTTETVQSATGKTFKIVKLKNTRSEGKYVHKTGVLHHSGGDLVQGSPGYEYDIISGDIVIEYRAHAEPQVAKSQKGMMRIRVKNFDGSEDKMQEAMDVLAEIGLEFEPADEEQLELFFWRHLYGIAAFQRKIPNNADGKKLIAATDAIKKAYQTKKGMSPSEELLMLREAWAIYMGKEKVEKANFMPQFSHVRPNEPGFVGGRPFWLRPDITLEELSKFFTLSQWAKEFDTKTDGVPVVLSGGLMSSEERLRLYGQWKTGMSSGSDQETHGSSGFVYTRQRMSVGSGGYKVEYYISPSVYLRTTNYAYPSDNYGEIENRKTTAPWDLPGFMAFTGGTNETMVKYMVSILDDIEVVHFQSQDARDKAVAQYKEWGITEIRGIPIEERFVMTDGEVKKTLAKVITDLNQGKTNA